MVRSRYPRPGKCRLPVALALISICCSCSDLPLDTDPLLSMAEVVSEEKRYPAPLTEAWRRSPNKPISFQPAVGTNNVYLVVDNKLVAWSVRTGATLWDAVDFESEISAAPVVIGQQVVIATMGSDSIEPRVWWFSSDGSLGSQAPVATSISKLNGEPEMVVYIDERGVGRLGGVRNWHTPLEKPATVNLATEHQVALITTEDGLLLAFRLNDGKIDWQYDAGTKITGAYVAKEIAYIGTAGGDLIAFNLKDGRIEWQRILGTSVVGSPAQTEELLWVAGLDARLTALKAENGTHLYTVDLSSRNYLDITPFTQWIAVGAHYGPWLAVRGPSRAEEEQGLLAPVQIQVQGPPVTNQAALSIPAGSGPAGLAVVNGDGMVVFLEPQRAH
ncbi:MAG: hypothetical protein CL478_04390 [Acidobacteria bacterium]|nr:hypothetical protein [Acidobacteriota bacterium]